MSELDAIRSQQFFEIGKKALEDEDWLLAVKSLRKAVVLEPGNAEAYPLLIQAALAMKNQRLVAEMIGRVAVNMPKMLDDVLNLITPRSATGPLPAFHKKPSPGSMAQIVYQLKITLTNIAPPVWRCVLVKSDITLAKLHRIIQLAMGWTNSHLHLFETMDGMEYSDPQYFEEDIPQDEKKVKLNQLLLAANERLLYRYDLGDNWEHDVCLEQILSADAEQYYPVCTDGKRAVPPEDVGGTHGYAEFLKAIADPQHEEHDSFIEWIGGEFDAEAFDIDKVNAALRRIRWRTH
jgi:hypothetical protein